MTVGPRNMQEIDVDGGRAWVVLIATYTAVIVLCTILYMNGLYLSVLVEYYQEDLAKTSMIGALNSSLLCLFAPVVSVFMDTYSCRVCVVFGGFLLGLSYFTSFFFRNVNSYIFTIGIVGGIGNSFAGIPLSVLIAYHFDRWRGTFLSFKEVLVGFGMFVASPVLYWFIDMFGINGSFLIVSGLAFQIIILGLLCAPNSEERKLMKYKFSNKYETQSSSYIFLQTLKSNTLLSLRLCKDAPFILFMVSTFSWNFTLSAVSLHLPRYMVTQGFEEVAVITVMTIFGLSNTFGRFCAATTTGKGGLDSYIVHIGTLGVLNLVAILFPLYGSWTSAGYLFSALIGFYTGVPNALMVKITVSLVGIKKLTSAYGLAFFFCGIGVLGGPAVIGIAYEVTQLYDYSFMTIGYVGLFGTFASLFAFNGKNTLDISKEKDSDITPEDGAAFGNLVGEERTNSKVLID